jgi:acetyl esterase
MSPTEAPSPDLLAQLMAQNPPKDVFEMRAMLDGLSGMLNADMPEVGGFHEQVPVREVAGASVTADVVVPRGTGPHPVLGYLHGGGWVAGSAATHRKLAHRFAEAGYLVFNVDYRLAPEHAFPAPWEDCVHAIRWAARTAERYGGDASRLAVGGDSAGGNLTAAALATLADDPSAPGVSAALLLYGVFDFAEVRPPEGDDPAAQVGAELMRMMIESYLGPDPSASVLADPRVSPIHVAEKLPPCHLVVGEADPLVAQQHSLALALEKAQVPHESVVVPGMPHGFAQIELFPEARESIDRMVAFLRTHL